jgi:hypothetical protein
MQQNSAEEPLFSARRACVVQFYADTEVAHGRAAGRVEHLVRAQATHFHSWDELLVFIARVLTALGSASSDER